MKPKPKYPSQMIRIEIDPKILKKFKAQAAMAGKSMQKLLGELVTFWINAQK